MQEISIRDNSLSADQTAFIDYTALEQYGIELAQVWFQDESGNEYKAEDLDNDGVAELSITEEMAEGVYAINRVSLTDDTPDENNNVYYSNGRLNDIDGDETHNIDQITRFYDICIKY